MGLDIDFERTVAAICDNLSDIADDVSSIEYLEYYRNNLRGIGCDIVNISRIKSLLANSKFLAKVCTDYEQIYCKDRMLQTVAGLWAAKEAVSKLLSTGFCCR